MISLASCDELQQIQWILEQIDHYDSALNSFEQLRPGMLITNHPRVGVVAADTSHKDVFGNPVWGAVDLLYQHRKARRFHATYVAAMKEHALDFRMGQTKRRHTRWECILRIRRIER